MKMLLGTALVLVIVGYIGFHTIRLFWLFIKSFFRTTKKVVWKSTKSFFWLIKTFFLLLSGCIRWIFWFLRECGSIIQGICRFFGQGISFLGRGIWSLFTLPFRIIRSIFIFSGKSFVSLMQRIIEFLRITISLLRSFIVWMFWFLRECGSIIQGICSFFGQGISYFGRSASSTRMEVSSFVGGFSPFVNRCAAFLQALLRHSSSFMGKVTDRVSRTAVFVSGKITERRKNRQRARENFIQQSIQREQEVQKLREDLIKDMGALLIRRSNKLIEERELGQRLNVLIMLYPNRTEAIDILKQLLC